MNFLKTHSIHYIFFLVVGLLLGWVIFGKGNNSSAENAKQLNSENETQLWTCSMHPQIQQEKSAKCPICAMDLIPLKISGRGDEGIEPDAITMSKEAIALANIQTVTAMRGNPVKELHLYGTIQPSERLLRSQVSHVNGRIERLVINVTGETITTGQVIAAVYSPDLQNAQQELLEAKKLETVQPALLEAAREKLRQWKLSDSRIADMERTGRVSALLDITADVSGVVTAKRVAQGDYVTQGSVLYDVADLSLVWAMFDAYETDLPCLKVGDRVEYTLTSLPGKTFSGKIAFIDPSLNKTTRTTKIRVETANPNRELKPEMYASAVIRATLPSQGAAIIIPKTALLWTGKRSIVYVQLPASNPPAFVMREVELGADLGESYAVLAGLNDGESVVTSGAFAIDASAQLEGKKSMMNTDRTYAAASDKRKHASISVRGNCDMCKNRIEKAASVYGTLSPVVWDSDKQLLQFDYFEDSVLENATKAVAKAGHDAGKYRATDSVYNALPECCKYR